MADYLAPLPVQQVAAWYRRLADMVAARLINGETPYAAVLLRHYLDNRDPHSSFALRPRPYLWGSHYVLDTLRYHRDVFLTRQEARIGTPGLFGSSTKRVGIVPRLKGEPGFQRWQLPGQVRLEYQSLVEVGGGPLDILRIQQSGSNEERDLFTALRGFQLRSSVVVSGERRGATVIVSFPIWKCDIFDRYDWNFDEHLTMPNPDFGSHRPDAVRPSDQSIIVYHRNAKRLEDARLAAPFDVRSVPWDVRWPEITRPAAITL